MKYRHSFHAGNFADVHKHVTLLTLLRALKRKEKGFLYLETHAGRGLYDLTNPTAESAAGIGKLKVGAGSAEELLAYGSRLEDIRSGRNTPRLYPGSPLLAVHELRSQDRAVLIEIQPAEARLLEEALGASHHRADAQKGPTTHRAGEEHRPGGAPTMRVECGDGYERLRAWLPPPERRGLTFIDPPYEETARDFDRVNTAIAEALRRFATGVIAVWYPIKDERETARWLAGLAASLPAAAVAGELWLYPPDSRVGLNGSGLLIVNPPYLVAERMQVWLPQLQQLLRVGGDGGTRVRTLTG